MTRCWQCLLGLVLVVQNGTAIGGLHQPGARRLNERDAGAHTVRTHLCRRVWNDTSISFVHFVRLCVHGAIARYCRSRRCSCWLAHGAWSGGERRFVSRRTMRQSSVSLDGCVRKGMVVARMFTPRRVALDRCMSRGLAADANAGTHGGGVSTLVLRSWGPRATLWCGQGCVGSR